MKYTNTYVIMNTNDNHFMVVHRECDVDHYHSEHDTYYFEKLLKEGKHKGWQSRNIISYPEKFWKKVLEKGGDLICLIRRPPR